MSDSNSDISDNQIKVPDAGQPLVFFIIVTTIFFFLSYQNAKVDPEKLYLAYQSP